MKHFALMSSLLMIVILSRFIVAFGVAYVRSKRMSLSHIMVSSMPSHGYRIALQIRNPKGLDVAWSEYTWT